MVFVNSCGCLKISTDCCGPCAPWESSLNSCVVFKGNFVINTGTKGIRQQGVVERRKMLNYSFPVHPSRTCWRGFVSDNGGWWLDILLVRVVKCHGVSLSGYLFNFFIIYTRVPYSSGFLSGCDSSVLYYSNLCSFSQGIRLQCTENSFPVKSTAVINTLLSCYLSFHS